MDAKMGKFFEFVGSFFSDGCEIPWFDIDALSRYLKESRAVLDDRNSPQELRKEARMRVDWALVHSDRSDIVRKGIDLLKESLELGAPYLQAREKLFLIAVGYYRIGEYSKSREYVDRCIKMQPDYRQALTLKKMIENKITKDDVRRMGITATAIGAVGLIAAGMIASSLARKK